MQLRIYQSPGLQPEELAQFLQRWLADNDYNTQFLRTVDGSMVIKAYQPELWRSVLGVRAALTIEITTLSTDQIEVRVGAGAWIDKLLSTGLGVLSVFFIPLILTVAWGTWQQSQLDKRIWEVIEAGLPTAAEQVIPMTVRAASTLPEDWFDPQTGEIYSIRLFERMDSWQNVMADGVIAPEEIMTQRQLVLDLLQKLESELDDETHGILGEAFGELTVLQGMQSYAFIRHLLRSDP